MSRKIIRVLKVVDTPRVRVGVGVRVGIRVRVRVTLGS